MSTKDFRQDFNKLLSKLKQGEHFAFTRFSDGELRIMQNTELKLAKDHNIVLGQTNSAPYASENLKHFIPEKHSFYRDKLMEAYRFKKHNYYVGLSCRCCVGDQDFQQMLDWYEGDTNSEFLTWSNLLLNGNYDEYKQHFIPEFSKRKVVIICNENAQIENLPFTPVKDFRVGPYCFVNDYGLIDTVKNWIKDNNIKDHVFLISAASLSELLIHQLFEVNNDNTYIDIGSTLNHYLNIDSNRGYLKGSNRKMCIW